jgi:hypothetical protein
VVAATDAASTKAACQAVVKDYRVYRVVHPKVFFTAAADATLFSAASLKTRAADASGDTTNINQLIDDAVAMATPVPGTVGAITAATYNANTAVGQSAFVSARADLKVARLKLEEAAKLLRNLPQSSTTSTTAPAS